MAGHAVDLLKQPFVLLANIVPIPGKGADMPPGLLEGAHRVSPEPAFGANDDNFFRHYSLLHFLMKEI
jgi:hypothetical protein